MNGIERILLATYLMPHSDRAMERAVQLAVQFGAELSVLFVLEPRAGGRPLTRFERLAPPDIEAELRRHLQAVPEAGSLAPFVTVMQGEVAEVVASYSALWGPDIIVGGTHSSGAASTPFAVSTVERICVTAARPLLVVRNRPFGPYASALVPVDFQANSRPSVQAAFSLVREGSVHLLHVAEIPGILGGGAQEGSFEQDFTALLQGLPVQGRAVGHSVRYGIPLHEIVETAHSVLPDLIVMGTAGRNGLGRMLIGSTAHEVLEHLLSDVVLVRA